MLEDFSSNFKDKRTETTTLITTTYSASADDIAVQSCFFNIQLTTLSPRNCIPPDVLLRVSMHPAWSASEKVVSSKTESFGYQSPMLMETDIQKESQKRPNQARGGKDKVNPKPKIAPRLPRRVYEDAIVVPEIEAANFEIKHGLLTLVQNKQFFEHDKEDPHAHIRYFNKIHLYFEYLLILFETPSQVVTLLGQQAANCSSIIKSKSKVRHSRNKAIVAKVSTSASTSGVSPDVAKLKDMVRALLLDKQTSPVPAPAPVKAVEQSCVTCGGAHSYRNCPATDSNNYRDNIQEYVSQAAAANFNQGNSGYRPPNDGQPNQNQPGFLPCQHNSQANNRTRWNQNQKVGQAITRENIPRKDDLLALKFMEIFRNLHFELSFADALLHMPKFAPMFRKLLNNKDKILELTKTPVNENCSAVILKTFPEKLGDPGRFLIPCDFPELNECLALADLGASINLMPLSVFEKLNLQRLTKTRMQMEIPLLPLKMIVDTTSSHPHSFEKDILLLEAILNSEPLSPLPNHANYFPGDRKELKICEAKTDETSIDEPPEVELKDLPPHLEYAFLEGDNKLPVIIAKDLSVWE
ncbi:reverse transcriptase domain-containing protein [Tanacetum coccineum]|uniref:Reverse transcriptase domain-containing protein n=1 Tax=Tanacetum coccineum TaxID=301880 RepID=A0ABQ5GJ30_9ASTR